MTAITNGTPKQIAWAHDIRASARRLRAFAESELPIASRRARVLVPAVLGAIRWDAPDAAYWIEARNYVDFLPYDLDCAEAHQDIAAADLMKRIGLMWSRPGFQALHEIGADEAAAVLLACEAP